MNSSTRGTMLEAVQRVVVIQDASRDVSSSAIRWAIDGLSLKPGDELTLLGVLHHFTNPMGYKIRVDSSSMLAANQKFINQEVTRKEEEYQNSKEMLQISKLFEKKKIAFHRRIVAADSPKVAALEAAKNLKATWIILDRQMKKDKTYFLDGLSCGISRIKRNNSVELLRGPKTTRRNGQRTDRSQRSNVHAMLPGPQMKRGIPEMIEGIPDDEDLFSLELFPIKHSTKILTWKSRMNIALGVARGLNYLHQNSIIHRDTRPNNILLTHDYEPLIGDFGLARKQNNESESLSEKKVVGTIGYLAPEYAERGRVSTKTDVYSFGVVLLELITGRTTGDTTLQENSLVGWARPLLKEKKYPELIDERILDCHDVHQLFWMVRVVDICLRKDPDKRPSMGQVEHALKCTIKGEPVTGIEDLSPTCSSDSSLPNTDESQGEQETDIQESTSKGAPSVRSSKTTETFSIASSTQSSKSQSTSTSFKGPVPVKRKSSRQRREKSRSQVLYDEMLS